MSRRNIKKVSEFPELVAQWHPSLNGDLKPEDVSFKSHRKIFWKCSKAEDHVWCSSPNDRISKECGCSCCSGSKVVKSNCFSTTHPELALFWHPTKNGKLTPSDVVAGSHKKVYWKCPKADDHEWITTVNKITHGRRCPCCGGSGSATKVVKSNCLATLNPEVAKLWHPTKNLLTPFDVTPHCAKKAFWRCIKFGHVWESVIGDVANGHGCPICRESKGEKEIARVLTSMGFLFKRGWRFPSCKSKLPLPFDFVVCTSAGIKCIEYQGQQHYTPVGFSPSMSAEKIEDDFRKLQQRDAIKRNWCRDKQVSLLEISFQDFDKIEELVKEFL